MEKKKIIFSESLNKFIDRFSEVKRGHFVNKDHEEFESLIFCNNLKDGKNRFCNFSSKLGTLSNAQLKADKDNLMVIAFEGNDHYTLCKKSEKAWETVDLK